MPTHAGKLLLDALDKHWDKYRKRLQICRHDPNEESVHNLRTGSRRLLSLLELFRALVPQPPLSQLRKMIKAQLDGFDELRDTQVMLIEIGDTVETLPELMPFLLHLQRREQQLLLETQAFIETLSIGKLKRKLKKAHNRCKRPIARRNINAAVLAAIDSVYSTALNRYQAVDPAQLPSIHRFRIAVKKLRYILAAAQPLLPGFPEEQPKQMQDYLTLLGDIQNSAVLIQTLEIFFDSGVPLTIQKHFQRQQQDLLDAFMLRKDEVLGFWRVSGDQELPWGIGSGDWDLG